MIFFLSCLTVEQVQHRYCSDKYQDRVYHKEDSTENIIEEICHGKEFQSPTNDQRNVITDKQSGKDPNQSDIDESLL